MTDYGQFYEDDDEREERLARQKRERERQEQLRVDKEFEEIVLKSNKKKNSCSHNSDLVKFTQHLKEMRKLLKAAADDGFCLDEIIDGLKVLGDD